MVLAGRYKCKITAKITVFVSGMRADEKENWDISMVISGVHGLTIKVVLRSDQ